MSDRRKKFVAPPKPVVRIWAYRRVSTTRQVREFGDFGSLEKQECGISQLIHRNLERNWKLEQQVDDPAESGDDPLREGIQRIRNAASGRQLDVLVVYEQDRLARDWASLRALINELEACGVRIVDARGDRISCANSGDYSSTMYRAVQSELDLFRIRERRSNDTALTAAKGVWSGSRPPQGFDAQKKEGHRTRELVWNSEMAIPIECFARIDNGVEPGALLADLDKRDIRTPSMKRKIKGVRVEVGRRRIDWDYLQQLLTNPIYRGCLRLRKEKYQKAKDLLPEPLEILPNGDVLYRGLHKQPVADDRWKRVSEKFQNRERIPRMPKTCDCQGRFLLQGITTCAVHGASMTPDRSRYVCLAAARRTSNEPVCCSVRSVPAPILEDSVMRVFSRIATHEDMLNALVEESRRVSGVKPDGGARVARLRAQRAEKEKQCAALVAAISESKSPGARKALGQEHDNLKASSESLEREIQRLYYGLASGHCSIATFSETIQDAFGGFHENRFNIDRPKMKELLRKLLHSIVIHPRVARGADVVKSVRVELRLKYPQLSRGPGGAQIPLSINLDLHRKNGTYSIKAPFQETVSIDTGRKPIMSDQKHPLNTLRIYQGMLASKSQAEIANEVKKTRAHVSQILSLDRILLKVRTKIRTAPLPVQRQFSLNRLLTLAKLSPTLQEIEANALLGKTVAKAA